MGSPTLLSYSRLSIMMIISMIELTPIMVLREVDMPSAGCAQQQRPTRSTCKL